MNSIRISSMARRFAMSVDGIPTNSVTAEKGSSIEAIQVEGSATTEKEERWKEKEEEKQRRSGWKEYLEQAKELIEPDGGPPRWFSPLECRSRLENSPLMLFLPGKSY